VGKPLVPPGIVRAKRTVRSLLTHIVSRDAVGALLLVVLLTACSSPSVVVSPTVPAPVPTATLLPPPPTPTTPLPPATPTPKPIALEPRTPAGDYFLGQADAPVTFEMFGDFQCPACGEFARTIEPPFQKAYVDTGKVKFVWHDYTWIGDESFAAAQAARCAGQQGHFWDYHDYLYAHQRGENEGQFSAANLNAFAASVGLDRPRFSQCFENGQDLPAIKEALNAGIGRGVDVTPTFLINGDLKVGAPPLNRLSGLMDYYLARTSH
jgi:protein-disulfide isomerase